MSVSMIRITKTLTTVDITDSISSARVLLPFCSQSQALRYEISNHCSQSLVRPLTMCCGPETAADDTLIHLGEQRLIRPTVESTLCAVVAGSQNRIGVLRVHAAIPKEGSAAYAQIGNRAMCLFDRQPLRPVSQLLHLHIKKRRWTPLLQFEASPFPRFPLQPV